MSSPLLEATSITKTYAGVRALKGVSFDLGHGEVHALVGENGAGKSTLIRIMTGATPADSGTLVVDGRPVAHMDPHVARSLGIAAIYQQPSLFPHLTVAENIALALERGGAWRRVNWPERHRAAADILARVGAAIAPERLAGTLSMPEQQMVEIAKAIGADARVLIMDEPTASLTDRDVARLFEVIDRLRAQGVGVIYISHRLEEVFAVADRITVLRDGETIETRARGDVDRAGLIRLMVGRELSAVFPKRTVAIGDVVLELDRVSHRASGVHDVSLAVRRGEILGMTGLVGSGRTELAEVLFGLRPADSGVIRLRGVPVRPRHPADAIRLGIGYVPEDRRQHGVVLEMSVAANATLANLRRVSRLGLLDRAAERAIAARYVDELRIKTPSIAADVGALSGGNQQKVALARWLSIEPAVLILDEPTQGVDVAAKSEIHDLMGKLAARGVAILMISSEMPEILGMSDRIAVMRTGTIRAVLPREEATQAKILALALGHREAVSAISALSAARFADWKGAAFSMPHRHRRELSVAIAIGALCLVLAVAAPGFFSSENLSDLFLANMPVLLVALGAALVILTGEIDISVGSVFAICGVVAGVAAKAGLGILLVGLVTCLTGASLAAVNGSLVAYVRLPSIVVTLATMVALRDGLRWATGGAWVSDLPASFQWLGLSQAAYPLVAFAVVTGLQVAISWGMRHLAAGRAVYATGSNEDAARLAGIDTRLVKFTVFAIGGVLTAVAALLNAVRFNQIPTNAGLGLEMKVIAAVVVGGVAIRGGSGTFLGTLLGVVLLAAIGPALVYLGVSPYWERAIQGAIILAAVAVDALRASTEKGRGTRDKGILIHAPVSE